MQQQVDILEEKRTESTLRISELENRSDILKQACQQRADHRPDHRKDGDWLTSERVLQDLKRRKPLSSLSVQLDDANSSQGILSQENIPLGPTWSEAPLPIPRPHRGLLMPIQTPFDPHLNTIGVHFVPQRI